MALLRPLWESLNTFYYTFETIPLLDPSQITQMKACQLCSIDTNRKQLGEFEAQEGQFGLNEYVKEKALQLRQELASPSSRQRLLDPCSQPLGIRMEEWKEGELNE